MTIQGINGYTMPTVVPGHTRTPGPDTSQSPGLGAPEGTDARQSAQTSRASTAVPAEAPQGTDPMLWSVLTSEERSFFARARAMGQITYGPGTRTQSAAVPMGGRLDVRV
jgi:hypothetical protein